MKMKKRIVVLLMALVLAVGLIGCKDTLKSIVHKASGTSDEVQEEDKMDYIVGLIDRVLHDPENEANIAAVRKDVNALMADYPLFAW